MDCSTSSNKDREEHNQSSISKCFGFAGLMGILGAKVDEDKEPRGEDKIIHMIKLAKLSHEV